MTSAVSEYHIENSFKEITRHVLAHDVFDSMYIEQNVRALEYQIECHCGKKWHITVSEMTFCNVEAQEIVDFVEGFNTQVFHESLQELKEKGQIKADKKKALREKIKSPTISYLEI